MQDAVRTPTTVLAEWRALHTRITVIPAGAERILLEARSRDLAREYQAATDAVLRAYSRQPANRGPRLPR